MPKLAKLELRETGRIVWVKRSSYRSGDQGNMKPIIEAYPVQEADQQGDDDE